ncbi:hypothetical protein [Anaerocellum diazotrophicum]|uniref:hypothetical protein n=1 Tax=Caldicellulosiruptor diazotrophicus TaxID=2806205 RepID=UPI001A91BC80|nr:hypothetical protein [Caldicellulosiruptor diazotrophicus]
MLKIKTYLVYIKNFRGRIISLLILLLLNILLLVLIPKKINQIVFSLTEIFLLTILIQSRFYLNAEMTRKNNAVSLSFLPLLLSLPIKRRSIVIMEFLSEVILILIYIFVLNIPYIFYSKSLNIPLFVFPLTVVIGIYSVYAILAVLVSLVKIKNIASILLGLLNSLFFCIFYFVIFAMSKTKNNTSLLSYLYYNTKNLLLLPICSVILFFCALWINIKIIYSRDF